MRFSTFFKIKKNSTYELAKTDLLNLFVFTKIFADTVSVKSMTTPTRVSLVVGFTATVSA